MPSWPPIGCFDPKAWLNPCNSLDRTLFAIGDEQGNVAVVSVAWVGFRNRRDAGEFKKLIDVHGTGDITPLATPLLDAVADLASWPPR